MSAAVEMQAVKATDLIARARAYRIDCDRSLEEQNVERARRDRESTLDYARREFKKDFAVDLDSPDVIHYWTVEGQLRVTVGDLLIAFHSPSPFSNYSLLRECKRPGCQHASVAIWTPFNGLYELGVALDKEPVHEKDCTVEWDDEGDPIYPAKPKELAASDIAAQIAADLGVIPGQAPEWFLQYQMRVSTHVAKLHTRINEVAAALNKE